MDTRTTNTPLREGDHSLTYDWAHSDEQAAELILNVSPHPRGTSGFPRTTVTVILSDLGSVGVRAFARRS